MSIARGAAFRAALCISLAVFATALVAALPGARAWAKGAPGGLSTYSPETSTEPAPPSAPAGKAVIRTTAAPSPAWTRRPPVRRGSSAANQIRTKPYIWGGGHGRWWDAGYDCSGAVSFALHGGGLLASPMTSGRWSTGASSGAGRWITVYANAGHAFAVIAGLRWDTVGDTSGTGPRWHASMVSERRLRRPPSRGVLSPGSALKIRSPVIQLRVRSAIGGGTTHCKKEQHGPRSNSQGDERRRRRPPGGR